MRNSPNYLSANKKQVIDADQSEGSFTSQQRRKKPPSACTNELQNVFFTVYNPIRELLARAYEKFWAPLGQVHEDSVRCCGRRVRIHVGSRQTLSTHLDPSIFRGFF